MSLRELGSCVDHGGLERELIIEELNYLREVFHAIDVEVIDHSRLGGVLLGQDKSVEMHLASKNRHGQSPLDGLHRPIER